MLGTAPRELLASGNAVPKSHGMEPRSSSCGGPCPAAEPLVAAVLGVLCCTPSKDPSSCRGLLWKTTAPGLTTRRQVTPQGATQAIAPHQAVYEQGASCTCTAYFGGLFSDPNTDNYQQAVISHPTPAFPQPWKEVWHAEHQVLMLPAARRGWRALQASERRRAALAAFASEGCTCQNPAPGELRGRAKRPGACPQAAAPGSNPPPSTSTKSQHQV